MSRFKFLPLGEDNKFDAQEICIKKVQIPTELHHAVNKEYCDNNSIIKNNFLIFNFFNIGDTQNKWLSHNISTTNIIPLYFTFDVSLVGIMYSNRDTNTDIDLEFYNNGAKVYTIQIRDTRLYRKSSSTSLLDLDMGDKFSLYAKKVSTNTPKDVNIDLIFRIRTIDTETGDEN
jgi:hypothetical protein